MALLIALAADALHIAEAAGHRVLNGINAVVRGFEDTGANVPLVPGSG